MVYDEPTWGVAHGVYVLMIPGKQGKAQLPPGDDTAIPAPVNVMMTSNSTSPS